MILGGFARLSALLQKRVDVLRERHLRKTRILTLATGNIILAAVGFFFIFTGTLAPSVAMVAILIASGLIEIVLRIGK